MNIHTYGSAHIVPEPTKGSATKQYGDGPVISLYYGKALCGREAYGHDAETAGLPSYAAGGHVCRTCLRIQARGDKK